MIPNGPKASPTPRRNSPKTSDARWECGEMEMPDKPSTRDHNQSVTTAEENARALELIAQHTGYSVEAILFVMQALQVANQFCHESLNLRVLGEEQHICALDLCRSVSGYAKRCLGDQAQAVFNNWNLRTVRDVGAIVYSLVNAKFMGTSP